MKILLLAPTELELSAITFEHPQLDKRICGVGGIALSMYLIPFIEPDAFDITILIGLAGGIPNDTRLGQVVKVGRDVQGDLGVFENNHFVSFEDMHLVPKNEVRSDYNVVDDVLEHLQIKHALSTNTLFEDLKLNAMRHSKYETDIENMEGAAFQQICEEYEVPYLQLRAISNYIGERDKTQWKIKTALSNLNEEVTNYLKSIL